MTQRNYNIEYLIIIYNLIEAYIAIIFGIGAASIGLLAFGLESMVEAVLGLILIVRVNMDGAVVREVAIRRHRKIKSWAAFVFFLLGAYLLFETVRRWLGYEFPKPTLGGLIIALISLIITPVLTALRFKSSADSPALTPNLHGIFFYSSLPLMLFIGLGLNYCFGWWQADLALAVLIAIFLIIRGYRINA